MEDIRLFPVSIGTRAMHSDLPEEDDDKYWVRITASNDKLDRHNSMMDPKTTLKNFEKDAKAKPGVSLKDHHAWRSFGYGRSANAILTDKNELLIDFFILKNMEYDGGSREFRTSEKLIRAIEHELINQVSIGFYDAREICNLCNLRYGGTPIGIGNPNVRGNALTRWVNSTKTKMAKWKRLLTRSSMRG